MKVTSTSNSSYYDISNSNFTIREQISNSLTVTSPNGGQVWDVGSTHNITWSRSGNTGSSVKLQYSTNGGSSWKSIHNATPNDGSYSWRIPDAPSTNCLVKVTSTSNSSYYDISNSNFTIREQISNSLTVTSPNGGQVWDVGSTHNITWSRSGNTGSSVKLQYSTNGGSSWKSIHNATPNDGSYSWRIPDAPSTNCLVKVTSTSNSSYYDISNSNFTIREQISNSLTVTSPNGGQVWDVGSTHNITWSRSGNTGSSVKLQYSTNGGSSWKSIHNATPNDGSYSWRIPDAPSTNCLVKVTSTSNSSYYDISNSNFTIQAEAPITVISPNGGEVWNVGSTQYITWAATGYVSHVMKLAYSTDSGSSWTIFAITSANDGYPWVIPDDVSANCRIRVAYSNNSSIYDISDSDFTVRKQQIPNSLTVTSPNGGEVWHVGSTRNITWSKSGSTGSSVKLQYSTNGGSSWKTIHDSTPNDGSYSWRIPNEPSTNCLVKLTSTSNSLINDICNRTFTIRRPSNDTLTLTSPNGGEVWHVGRSYYIKWWEYGETGDFVKLQYSTDGGGSWKPICDSTPNDRLYSWQPPVDASTNCRVKVTSVSNSSIYDISNADFTIHRPSNDTLNADISERWRGMGCRNNSQYYLVEFRHTQ